ncbi:MAG: hypothetical protein R3F35_22960 [Myxococcota bacterium]
MKIRAVLLASALLLVASAAQALVTFTVQTSVTGGHPLSAVQVGDTITLDIRISNPGGGNVFGIGAAAFGWDNAVINYTSGNAVAANILPSQCFGDPVNVCIGGMTNSAGGARPEGTPTALSGRNVQIVNAVDVAAHVGEASDQAPGLDGIIGGGDAQFRLVFTAAAEGTTTLEVGTKSTDPVLGNAVIGDGGSVSEASNALLNITVPEPGAVAAGLAAIGSVIGVAGVRRRI